MTAELARSRRGRALAYDLASTHAHSLLLGWLLNSSAKQRGFSAHALLT